LPTAHFVAGLWPAACGISDPAPFAVDSVRTFRRYSTAKGDVFMSTTALAELSGTIESMILLLTGVQDAGRESVARR